MPSVESVLLTGAGNASVVVNADAAKQCGVLNQLIDEAGEGTESGQLHAPIKVEGVEVNQDLLDKLLKYMDLAKQDSPTVFCSPLNGDIDALAKAWEKAFISTDLLVNGDVFQHNDLIRLLNLAHYLKYEPLEHLLAAWCASMCERITKEAFTSSEVKLGRKHLQAAEDIRRFFNVVSDWTPEEEEKMRAELEFSELNYPEFTQYKPPK
jgi:S-phase kinase-associated protein 1